MSSTQLQAAGTVVTLPVRSLDDDFPNLCTHGDSISPTIIVPSEPTRTQRMAIVEASGTLNFWDEPEEDVYSADDGEPV